jgi:hypothetical protein
MESTEGAYWKPEPELGQHLFEAIPDILDSQKENGQFGTEPWIPGDQNELLPLSAVWELEDSPYHHNEQVLEAIVRGGNALIAQHDSEGAWTNRKKDGSTWGQHHMPWTYSRWIRAYHIVRDALDEASGDRWDEALLLGFEEISKRFFNRIHNQPAHFAMALYFAWLVFDRKDWEGQAEAFMSSVAEEQSPHGWWAEHGGPVVSYNFVYLEALGTYFGISGDEKVLGALERGARYHANLTYPDGSAVETVDGRNPYHKGIRLRGPGFSHTAIGRGYLARQHALYKETGRRFPADYSAHQLLYGGEGPAEQTAADRDQHVYRMGDGAGVLRHRPWFCCVSGFALPSPEARWGQDRQNFISVFHDGIGLIVGGGNTKLQPLWSNFTVGETSLMVHKPGDEDPDFSPRDGLIHVPDHARYEVEETSLGVELTYGEEHCRVEVQVVDDNEIRLVYEVSSKTDLQIEAHVPLIPQLNAPIGLSSGENLLLDESSFDRTGEEWLDHAGYRLTLPKQASLVWPALPHNPYRKGGEATYEEGLLVVALPFQGGVTR